jgi:hypothetical protein
MTFTASIKFLQKKNKALRKLVSDLEELNAKQFDELHKAQLRIQRLESENAELRMENDSLYGNKLELMEGDGSHAK